MYILIKENTTVGWGEGEREREKQAGRYDEADMIIILHDMF